MNTIGTVLEYEHDTESLKDHRGVLGLYLSRARFKKRGKEYEAFCPLHSDRETPSCKLNQKNGRWLWHCFGACQRGGSIVDFVAAFDHLTDGDAIRRIRQELSCRQPEHETLLVLDVLEKEKKTVSWEEYAVAEKNLAARQDIQDWLLKTRGITFETAKHF